MPCVFLPLLVFWSVKPSPHDGDNAFRINKIERKQLIVKIKSRFIIEEGDISQKNGVIL